MHLSGTNYKNVEGKRDWIKSHMKMQKKQEVTTSSFMDWNLTIILLEQHDRTKS